MDLQYANIKAMKVLLMFSFFHYIWCIDSEHLCFILFLKEKMTRFQHFIIIIITFIQYMKQVKNYKSHKNGLFKPGKKYK